MSVGDTERIRNGTSILSHPMTSSTSSPTATPSASTQASTAGSGPASSSTNNTTSVRKQRSASSNTLIGGGNGPGANGALSTNPSSPISPTHFPTSSSSSNGTSAGVVGGVGGGSDLGSSTTPPNQPVRRSSFGLNFLSSITNSIRIHPALPGSADEQQHTHSHNHTHNHSHSHNSHQSPNSPPNRIDSPHNFMSNSPTIANLHNYAHPDEDTTVADLHNSAGNAGTTTATTAGQASNAGHIPLAHSNGSDEITRTATVVPSALEGGSSAIPGPSSSSSGSGDSNSNPNAGPSVAAIVAAVVGGTDLGAGSSSSATQAVEGSADSEAAPENLNGIDKDGFFSLRLTPIIDHSSSTSGLYFAPIIRKIKPNAQISIGRYTEKNKSAAHAPQGSSAPVVFKSKVVSRTHALFQCNDDGQWFIKDCKSSSGTFLNHIRLSPASQESTLMPLVDGDIIQLGMDYRGGTEEVYRCVKIRCEFNKSWQRKVNQFNLEIHKKLKNLAIGDPKDGSGPGVKAGGLALHPIASAVSGGGGGTTSDELSECAICLFKLEPCQALFISPCSHSWHYKCIRPIIIKSYPQFYCPNCRSMCDLETDIEDDE